MQPTATLPLEQSASSSHETAQPPEHAAPGEDVMKILADVEGQLSRLREVQKSQDEAILSLADRARALKAAEEEIEKIRRDLAQQKESLEKDRQGLAAQQSAHEQQARAALEELRHQKAEIARAQAALEQQQQTAAAHAQQLQKQQAELAEAKKHWDQQRVLHETELNKRHAEVEQASAALARRESELQAQQQRVETLRAQCEEKQQECDVRARTMEAEHAELLRRVEQAEKNVGELIEQLEQSQHELSEKAQQHEQAAKEAAQQRTRAAELENALHQATKRADQLERESVELAKLADREREAVETRLTAAQDKLAEACKDRDHAAAELESTREKMASLEKNLKASAAQLSERTAQLTESQKKLEVAGKKLSEFAKVLSEQAPQLERGAAAIAMVQEQQEQIDRLTKQLAEAKLRSDPEEMQRRDERIAQLTEALRQARGQAAGQQGIAELERHNAELTAEVNQLKLELQNAQLAAEDMKRHLEERVDEVAAATTQDAALAEHAARVAALTAEIEQLHASAAADLKAQLEAQEKKHRREMADVHQSDAVEIKSLRGRVKELEDELREAKATAAEGKAQDENKYAQKLREKAERITAVAEHLRRRRTRLAKYRLLLSQRAENARGGSGQAARAQEVLKLEQERTQLAEARQALAIAERQMVRKWAGRRSITTVAALTILMLVCAAGSWFLANTFAPARISASVTLESRNRLRNPLSPEQAQSWQQWHTELLSELAFQQVAAKRMAERRLDQFASPSVLAQKISSDLTIDAEHEGLITLTLAGTDADEITSVLDVLAATIAMESNRKASTRADNTPAVISSEHTDNGRTRYAAINPVPISDHRMQVAGISFGVMFAVVLSLTLTIYFRLAKARRVFESDTPLELA